MAPSNTDINDASAGQQDTADLWVIRALQDQPLVKAPATLEGRVFAALASTAAAPWWQQPLARWPIVARFTFVAASIACVWLGLAFARFGEGFVSGIEGTTPSATSLPGYASARALFDTLSALVVVVRTLAGSLPQLWLMGGLLLIGLLYASFFGLGAFGYRAFRPSR